VGNITQESVQNTGQPKILRKSEMNQAGSGRRSLRQPFVIRFVVFQCASISRRWTFWIQFCLYIVL